MALETQDRWGTTTSTVTNQRLYFLTLYLAGWQKNLYFCSTHPDDGAERFDVLSQQVETIGPNTTSMGDFVDRVTNLFWDGGFLRVQK